MPTACGVGLLYASLAAAHWRLPDATRTFRVRIRSGRRVRLGIRLGIVRFGFVFGSRASLLDRWVKLQTRWLAAKREARRLFWFFTAQQRVRERVWERSGREERGRVRATKYAAGLATGRRVFIHLFLLLFVSISVFSFFFLFYFFDRGTLALISTCWYLR